MRTEFQKKHFVSNYMIRNIIHGIYLHRRQSVNKLYAVVCSARCDMSERASDRGAIPTIAPEHALIKLITHPFIRRHSIAFHNRFVPISVVCVSSHRHSHESNNLWTHFSKSFDIWCIERFANDENFKSCDHTVRVARTSFHAYGAMVAMRMAPNWREGESRAGATINKNKIVDSIQHLVSSSSRLVSIVQQPLNRPKNSFVLRALPGSQRAAPPLENAFRP